MLAHGGIRSARDGLAQIHVRYPVLKQYTDEIDAALSEAQNRIRAELDRGQAARNQRKHIETKGQR
jgi:hypothetical protein